MKPMKPVTPICPPLEVGQKVRVPDARVMRVVSYAVAGGFDGWRDRCVCVAADGTSHVFHGDELVRLREDEA